MSPFTPFWSIAERLARFSKEEKERIENGLIYKEIPAKFRLVDFDETAHQAYFILEGFSRFYFINDRLDEITGFIFSPGQFFTSLESFLSRSSSNQAVESITPMKLLAINRDDLEVWMDEIPGIERMIRMVLQERMIYAQSVVASLIALKPEERYQNMLETRPDLVQHIPQHILSSYMGITPVSLSRIRSRIKEKPQE
ncbi:MAG: Crp/Fnr family transcriptional regulator [Bacteroidota bacterium]|nr:Crp/Fnr family transcriptional regulator [Bacteroidota bacterium]MDX5431037.1 Crp/Fnr family transcriptional regulator [Bacteroidota bacterium]MDX5469791.1 Crp/Fnr family transcriptional regulator [Bacteroidota bacterium]